MLITGQFRNVENKLITVNIKTPNDLAKIKTIGEDGLYFSGDPIEITTDNDDLFNVLVRKQATINLVTKEYLGDILFANNARDITVEITNEDDEILFAGYVDPNTYSQPFTHPLDEFSITCIDWLSTLQYYNYKNTTINTFADNLSSADLVSFYDIIKTAFEDFDYNGIFYDMSKGISSDRVSHILKDISVSENVFYGEDFDDVMTYEDVFTQILQYLNLHIRQEGKNVYIYDWQTIRNVTQQWVNIDTDTSVTNTIQLMDITSDIHSDSDTNISIDEVYNQIQITDNLDDIETVIESPLDDDALESPFTNKQLYMTEYSCTGSTSDFNKLMKGDTVTSEWKITDWFIRYMNNPNWKLWWNNKNLVNDYLEKDGNGKYKNQWKMAKFAYEHNFCPIILSMGSADRKSSDDDEPTSKIDMTTCMYFTINGNELDAEANVFPQDDDVKNAQSMIEYYGGTSLFSPSDDETTNYLVFSGKLIYQPITYQSGAEHPQKTALTASIMKNGIKDSGILDLVDKMPDYDGTGGIWSQVGITRNKVHRDGEDGSRYYGRRFHSYTYPNSTVDMGTDYTGVQPYKKNEKNNGFKFNYSAKWDGTDKVKKLSVLECELIIGNKRLVEYNIKEDGSSEFGWYEIGKEPTITFTDTDGTTSTYQLTTFSLGVNPAIGDYIIGEEFDIQNTVEHTMNIDAEGTAIPIKKSDNLNGAVIFRVLGPINSMWNEITRRHPSFWRHTKYYDNWHWVLAHTQNIIIKDFECKVYSDAAGASPTDDDNDLIYLSNETDKYINKKDDIEFEIITQLTSDECLEKGISTNININCATLTDSKSPLLTIYNNLTQETAKPEEHYVDQYYREYSTPKMLVEMSIHNDDTIRWYKRFYSTALKKKLSPLNETFDVKRNTKTITFKEI